MSAASEEVVTTPRMPGWMIAKPGEELGIERLRLRLAAYIYGNILVLAAIVVATGKSIVGARPRCSWGRRRSRRTSRTSSRTPWGSSSVASATRIGRDVRHEMRDALPILVSGVVPAVILLIATLDIVPTQLAQLVAAVWVSAASRSSASSSSGSAGGGRPGAPSRAG